MSILIGRLCLRICDGRSILFEAKSQRDVYSFKRASVLTVRGRGLRALWWSLDRVLSPRIGVEAVVVIQGVLEIMCGKLSPELKRNERRGQEFV